MPYVMGEGVKGDIFKEISPLFKDKQLSEAMKFAKYMADESKECGLDVLDSSA